MRQFSANPARLNRKDMSALDIFLSEDRQRHLYGLKSSYNGSEEYIPQNVYERFKSIFDLPDFEQRLGRVKELVVTKDNIDVRKNQYAVGIVDANIAKSEKGVLILSGWQDEVEIPVKDFLYRGRFVRDIIIVGGSEKLSSVDQLTFYAASKAVNKNGFKAKEGTGVECLIARLERDYDVVKF